MERFWLLQFRCAGPACHDVGPTEVASHDSADHAGVRQRSYHPCVASFLDLWAIRRRRSGVAFLSPRRSEMIPRAIGWRLAGGGLQSSWRAEEKPSTIARRPNSVRAAPRQRNTSALRRTAARLGVLAPVATNVTTGRSPRLKPCAASTPPWIRRPATCTRSSGCRQKVRWRCRHGRMVRPAAAARRRIPGRSGCNRPCARPPPSRGRQVTRQCPDPWLHSTTLFLTISTVERRRGSVNHSSQKSLSS